jgi:hypothetical protein
MGFLSPALLALGAALAVPLILHLLHRHQGPRVIFPALRYLRRAEKENARRIKLRQLLLMALRLAVLALLVLAAARPFLQRGGAGHEPTAVAIILDNSLSTGLITGEERVLDQLKARALETLAHARPEDRFWLIRAGSPWEPAAMAEPAVAAERVRETEISGGHADIDAALVRARTLLASGAEGRATEIHLLTDMQATSVSAATEKNGSGIDNPPVLIWGPRGNAPDNLGIAAVTIGGGIAPRAGESSTIAVRLTGKTAHDSIPVRLVIGDRIAAASTAAPGATTLLHLPPRPSGLVSGYVELDPDALRGDDRRYFVAQVQPPPSVAMTGSPAFIREALDVLVDAGRIRRAARGDADIVVAPAGVGIEVVRDGGTALVLAPASPTELPAVNRRLAEAGIPWRFAPEAGKGEARLATAGLDDEILAPLADVRIHEVYDLQRDGDADTPALLHHRDGRAWAVRGDLPEGGRYILVASPLSTNATTLPTSPALLPLLDRLTGAWASVADSRPEVGPGTLTTIPAEATAVLRPDGSRDSVMADGGYRVPGRPGIYQLLAGERVLDAFAVNPDPAESDLARLDDRALRTALSGWRPERITEPSDWPDAIYQQRLGKEVWRPLVLAALAFLLIEGLVAASGSGRVGAPGRGAPGDGGRTRSGIPVAATGSGTSASSPDKRTS